MNSATENFVIKIVRYIALMMIVVLIASCERPAKAEDFRFISSEFQDALKKINSSTFFSPPPPTHILDPQLLGVDKSFQTAEVARAEVSGRRYREIGEKLCQPVSDSYQKLFSQTIEGQNIYAFDEELMTVARKHGGYIFPLTGIGRVNGEYQIRDMEGFRKQYAQLKPYQRISNSVFSPESESFKYTRQYHENGSNYLALHELQSMIKDFGPVTLRSSDFKFEFVRRILFVFSLDEEDPSQEHIYYYVDFPYQVTGGDLGKTLSLKFEADPVNKVNCYLRSKSGMLWRSVTTPHISVEKGLAVPSIVRFEPITLPLHPLYQIHEVPKSEGGFEKNEGYFVEGKDISEPSLKCWLLANHIIEGGGSACVSMGYSAELLELLNKNICVWPNRTSFSEKAQYPLKLKPVRVKPSHINISDDRAGFVENCATIHSSNEKE